MSDRITIEGGDPVALARRFVGEGARRLHLVDLDGARQGRPINCDSVRAIVAAVDVPCQLGGGLRTEEHITQALGWGVRRVVVGTRALKEPAWLAKICRRFPGQVVLGIDAKEGQVATDGWLEVSTCKAVDLAKQCATWPLAALVYTDICKDGMLEGPNLEGLAELASAVSVPIIASGGITTLEDIRRLSELGLAGCIIGRALYEGRLNLREAIDCAKQ